jgi:uncharacterized membrane protein YecN with MAPEG domain
MKIEISDIIMWILVVVIIMGIVLCYYNLNNKKYINKYEGLIIISTGLISSCIAGIMSNK